MTRLSAEQRLRAYAVQRDDYKFYVGIPFSDPEAWAKVLKVTAQTVVVEDRGEVLLEQIRAFLVTYPNGQVVDDVSVPGRYLLPPPGVQSLRASEKRRTGILTAADLELGKQFIAIAFGKCVLRPHDPGYYSTRLTNISNHRVRILRFAAYANTKSGWRLSTVTRGFYTAEEFRVWYGLSGGEWIEPGRSVCDDNNYGGFPMLWAYDCESEDGAWFIAGEVIQRPLAIDR